MQVAWSLVLLVLLLFSQDVECKPGKGKRRQSRWEIVQDMQSNLTALLSKVQVLSNPVQIHVHGIDEDRVDSHGQGHHQQPEERLRGKPGFFEETHEHRHEHPDKGQGQSQGHSGGTNVHIHFNLPYPKSSSFTGHESKEGKPMSQSEEFTYAKCEMVENIAFRSHHKVQGYVALRQKPSQPLEIRINLRGFYVNPRLDNRNDMSNLHGLHVHQYGDFQNGCNTFGGHFNPGNTTHGGPHDTIRHAGDWGNVIADRRGNVRTQLTDRHATLFGQHTIIGRGIVVHDKADDLGKGGKAASLTTGDAGARLACCIVAVTQRGDNW